MNTPLVDFIRHYAASEPARLHMPGHKGRAFLGCESWDITEIGGADELFAPKGILEESERNAAALFGAEKTLYSTEGSSLCIRAMVFLATRSRPGGRPWILASRNAHKTFLYALALCDGDVQWLCPQRPGSLCACPVTPEQVESALRSAQTPPAAVYLTSPDYLGGEQPIGEIAALCHRFGVPLLVDNAHGAYLRFLPEGRHPMELGADMCCDSAHKTLPVLTGGAYLHISPNAPAAWREGAREAMALFASTSPSYLILASLDLCNGYLSNAFPEKLRTAVHMAEELRRWLRERGWQVEETEPLKLTLRLPAALSGRALQQQLREAGVECEYADEEYLVAMVSSETTAEELERLKNALGENHLPQRGAEPPLPRGGERVMSVREAIFAPSETVPVREAVGRICAAPTVSCPPAIPVAVSGERITAEGVELFLRCGMEEVAVVKETYPDKSPFSR